MAEPKSPARIDFESIRRQLGEQYIIGVPGQPSAQWREGARWALAQCEALLRDHHSGETRARTGAKE
jgi:hypothetical protein